MDVARIERISSLQNPLIKSVRKALFKGGATDDGLLVCEGLHLHEEARRSAARIVCLIGTRGALEPLPPSEARVVEVPAAMLSELSELEAPQGLITLVAPPEWDRAILTRPDILVLVLDGLQDPGNAGTILRSAEAFGVDAVIRLAGTVDFANPKVLRASAGSIFRVPVFREKVDALPRLKLYGAAGEATTSLSHADLKGGAAIVIGNEGRGLGAEVRKRAELVRIPTKGVESLNAATAAAILLYEAARQREEAAHA
jgi:RNA methyltransferase, TrmH family